MVESKEAILKRCGETWIEFCKLVPVARLLNKSDVLRNLVMDYLRAEHGKP